MTFQVPAISFPSLGVAGLLVILEYFVAIAESGDGLKPNKNSSSKTASSLGISRFLIGTKSG